MVFVGVKCTFGLWGVSGAGEIYTVAPPGSRLSKDLGVSQLGGILDLGLLHLGFLEGSRWQDTVSVTIILNT